MKWYCVISGMVEVEADTECEAIEEAYLAYLDGMDDVSCEGVTPEVKVSDCPETTPHCLTCAHCTAHDNTYETITCDVDKVPNGHREFHTCCLYEPNEALELV